MIEPQIVLRTDLEHLPTDGGDSVITAPPKVLTPNVLRKLADDMAALVGCRVHHAEFVLTTDPAVVRTFGVFPMHDGCEECDAGVRRAIAQLERDPDSPLLVGRLHWADDWRDTTPPTRAAAADAAIELLRAGVLPAGPLTDAEWVAFCEAIGIDPEGR